MKNTMPDHCSYVVTNFDSSTVTTPDMQLQTTDANVTNATTGNPSDHLIRPAPWCRVHVLPHQMNAYPPPPRANYTRPNHQTLPCHQSSPSDSHYPPPPPPPSASAYLESAEQDVDGVLDLVMHGGVSQLFIQIDGERDEGGAASGNRGLPTARLQ